MPTNTHQQSPFGTDSRPPIFISGISRGGTTWLSRCIGNHPQFAVFGETAFWGRHFEEPQNGEYYEPGQLAGIIRKLKFSIFHGSGSGQSETRDPRRHEVNAALQEFVSQQRDTVSPAKLFRFATAAVAAIEGKCTAVEKTPHHVNHIERILEHLPDARFILILRDPYDFMLSYKHQGDRKHESVRRRFQSLYHPLLAALVWKRCSVSLRRAVNRYPGRCLELRTESFANDAENVLQQVSEFVGLEAPDAITQLPAVNSSFPSEQRPSLMAADIFWLNLVARNEIIKSGYPLRKHRSGSLDILSSALKLPLWALSTIWKMTAPMGGAPMGRASFRYVAGYLSRASRVSREERTAGPLQH